MMNEDSDEDIGTLIDRHIDNLQPEVRAHLIRKTIEEFLRIPWIESDGSKWHCCFDCVHFKALKSDKKGTKIFMKKGFWGYCRNPTHQPFRSRKGFPHIHVIFRDTKDDIAVKKGIRTSCYKPLPKKENNFFDIMQKQEMDEIATLLENNSLTEEERKYFESLLKRMNSTS